MWSGSREAQKQADAAFRKLRPKSKKKRGRKRTHYTANGLEPSQVNYQLYIKCRDWRRKCRRFKAAVGNKCEICESTVSVQVHHRHYRTLGRETQADVKVLCGDCHRLEHETDGVKQMNELTAEFRAIVG